MRDRARLFRQLFHQLGVLAQGFARFEGLVCLPADKPNRYSSKAPRATAPRYREVAGDAPALLILRRDQPGGKSAQIAIEHFQLTASCDAGPQTRSLLRATIPGTIGTEI